MKAINLNKFYPREYINNYLEVNKDDFVWVSDNVVFALVSDEVAEELLAGKRCDRTHIRRQMRNKAHYSLDKEDGMEDAAGLACTSDSPEVVLEMMEQYRQLCHALNSLPEKQGRRIEKYFNGMTQQEIANDEGVSKASVNIAITRGIDAMRNYLKKFDSQV